MKHRRSQPHQLSYASLEFAHKKRVTRGEKFLAEMEQVVSWTLLQALIEPKYPMVGRVGCQPIWLAYMLRVVFLQKWFGLVNDALEDAIHGSQTLREFVSIDLGREAAPNAMTLLKFRRLLTEHGLTVQFESINAHLTERGLLPREGTMVDSTAARSKVANAHEVLHGQETAGYEGLAKKEAQLYNSLLSLANPVLVKKRLMGFESVRNECALSADKGLEGGEKAA